MSGFSTEKLHLSSSEVCSLLSSAICSQLRYAALFAITAGCKDCEWGVQPQSKVQSSVLVPTLDKLLHPSPVVTAASVSLPRRICPLSHKVPLMYFYSCVMFLSPANVLTWWAVLSTGVAQGQMNRSHCCPSLPPMSKLRCIKQAAAYGSCWKISSLFSICFL